MSAPNGTIRRKEALQSFECPECNFIVFEGDNYDYIDEDYGVCTTCGDIIREERAE